MDLLVETAIMMGTMIIKIIPFDTLLESESEDYSSDLRCISYYGGKECGSEVVSVSDVNSWRLVFKIHRIWL